MIQRGVRMDTKILLENGTNELEVLEFMVSGNSYGINVAKINVAEIRLFFFNLPPKIYIEKTM